jgi:type III secretion protein J
MKLNTVYRCAIAVALAVLLSGCSKQLLGSLDEAAANQVVSALQLEGVAADKTQAGEKLWKVTVAADEFAFAVQVLARRNLPPQQFQGLGQVFKKESLVSTPTEERARLIHAMSQELERSLMEIDGVLVARVHPVILPHDPLNPRRATATASVLIKYRTGVDMSGREGMVRALVAAGVEGMSYDDVRVVMVPAENRPALPDKGAVASGALYGWVIAVLLLGLLLSYALVQWRQRGNRAGQALGGRWAHTVSGFIGELRQPTSKPRSKRPGGAS